MNENILYVYFGCFVLLLLIAAGYDITSYRIPNWLVVVTACLFFPVAVLQPIDTDWLMHLGSAFAMLALGIFAYCFKWLGAGDVKLLAAVAIWIELGTLPNLIFYVALSGAGLAIAVLLMRRLLTSIGTQFTAATKIIASLPRVFQADEKIPYGVAIAIGSIWLGLESPHLGASL